MPRPTKPSTSKAELKRGVIREARRLGASLVGFAPVSRWADHNEVPANYRPAAIWKPAQTVIVMAVPMLLPIVESTPSINYQEMYQTGNALLDEMAFRLSVFLNQRGHASIPLPRDGYGSLEILLQKMPACFSHVYAAKYAGLGTIGFSHNLINPQFGPRARYVSVFTAAPFKGGRAPEKDLCKKCGLCGRLCPAGALVARPDRIAAGFDAVACTIHHQKLVAESRFPCGVCVKVCPIGEDRKLYKRTRVADYLREYKALEDNPGDAEYRHLTHLRTHGSGGGPAGGSSE
jgi:epoxyqueuosine reductase QueG